MNSVPNMAGMDPGAIQETLTILKEPAVLNVGCPLLHPASADGSCSDSKKLPAMRNIPDLQSDPRNGAARSCSKIPTIKVISSRFSWIQNSQPLLLLDIDVYPCRNSTGIQPRFTQNVLGRSFWKIFLGGFLVQANLSAPTFSQCTSHQSHLQKTKQLMDKGKFYQNSWFQVILEGAFVPTAGHRAKLTATNPALKCFKTITQIPPRSSGLAAFISSSPQDAKWIWSQKKASGKVMGKEKNLEMSQIFKLKSHRNEESWGPEDKLSQSQDCEENLNSNKYWEYWDDISNISLEGLPGESQGNFSGSSAWNVPGAPRPAELWICRTGTSQLPVGIKALLFRAELIRIKSNFKYFGFSTSGQNPQKTFQIWTVRTCPSGKSGFAFAGSNSHFLILMQGHPPLQGWISPAAIKNK